MIIETHPSLPRIGTDRCSFVVTNEEEERGRAGFEMGSCLDLPLATLPDCGILVSWVVLSLVNFLSDMICCSRMLDSGGGGDQDWAIRQSALVSWKFLRSRQ